MATPATSLRASRKFLSVLGAALGLAAFAAAGHAADAYPSKPVRVVVPLAPGGPTDTFGRMFSAYLADKYKQPSFVENRTGAGQVVGAEFVTHQPADGYTILVGSNGLAYESIINKDTPFDTTKAIQPFGIFAGSGMFLQIHPSLPVKSLAEFIAWVKANPGKLNLGTASVPLAPFEGMRDRLGLQWTYVNYKGGTPAETALLAGEVQAYFGDVKGEMQAKAGKLRVLAYSGYTRHPDAMDVPTFAESKVGLDDFHYILWLGAYTVTGVPDDITTKLNADINDMSKKPEALQRYQAMGWTPVTMTVPEVRKDVATTNAQVQAMVNKGLKLR